MRTSLLRCSFVAALLLSALASGCGGAPPSEKKDGVDAGASARPVASAGADQQAARGATVRLDGSASHDPAGATLTFHWTLQAPAGSGAQLETPDQARTSFVADLAGTFVATLVVESPAGKSDPAQVQISVSDADPERPVAHVGSDVSTPRRVQLTLDGRESSSPRAGVQLSFTWTVERKPARSSATLSDPFSPMPQLVPDEPGEYVVSLVVADGTRSSAPARMTITAVNAKPVADPGGDGFGRVGRSVALDGSASSDFDGDSLTYQWTLVTRPQGSQAQLSAARTAVAQLTPDVAGQFVARLVVNDGYEASEPATVTIEADPPAAQARPIARAGSDQQIGRHVLLTLDGSGSSDPNARPLTYLWVFERRPARSTAALSDPTSPAPSFETDEPGDYVARLVVNNGDQASDPARVTITAVNAKPVARIAANSQVHVKTAVSLDASQSSDGDRDPLTFVWTLSSKPQGSQAILQSSTSTASGFTADVAGRYEVQLVASDGYDQSPIATRTIDALDTPANLPPTANPGASRTVARGVRVVLDGGQSSDPEGAPLSFQWVLEGLPTGSLAQLSDPGAPNPAFTPDKPGDYVARLVVSDGVQQSVPARVTITAQNTKPVANAGADVSVAPRVSTTLSGLASRDADGDALNYAWSIASKPAGSSPSLTNATTARPSFSADVGGKYELQLVVDDGFEQSLPDLVVVTVSSNDPPVARAGSDRTVSRGVRVVLDGSQSSDPEGAPLTFQWVLESVPSGSQAQLADATTPGAAFTPDKPGDYTVRLAVSDGTQWSAPVRAIVHAPNRLPVADAGDDLTVATRSQATLSGARSSDADGDPLTYSWAITARPANSNPTLSNATTMRPTLVADAGGPYTLQLVVSDGYDQSAADIVVVTAVVNDPPVARPGDSRVVSRGVHVVMDGSQSSDPEGAPLTFQWVLESVPSGSQAQLADATTSTPSFTTDKPGDYVLRLVVGDGVQLSQPVRVIVNAANAKPIADAGDDFTGSVRANLVANGLRSSDADGDTLTYSWTIAAKPTSSSPTFTNSSSARPTLNADVAGTYTLQLVVSDGFEQSAPDTVMVTANANDPPVARIAGGDRVGTRALRIAFDGSQSSDPEGAPITYQWALESRPTGSAAPLSSSGVTSSFVPDKAGSYVVRLIVSDGVQQSQPARVTVTVPNTKPVANAGPDQSGYTGSVITLDGTRSSDPDGDSLSFSWTVTTRPSGSSPTLASATSRTPTFTADVAGTYEIQLIVNDGIEDGLPDAVVITVQQAPNFTTPTVLNYQVTDAEYSRALDRLVLVSANPNKLHIVNGATGSEQTVDLPLVPTSVSVSLDGQKAAVGYDAYVSAIDLAQGSIIRTTAVPIQVSDVVMGNGYVYAVTQTNSRGVWAVNVSTGAMTSPSTNLYGYTNRIRLHPSGNKLYGGEYNYGGYVDRYNLTSGIPAFAYSTSYNGNYSSVCGELWASDDGLRLFTRCAVALRLSDDRSIDLTYNGTLPGMSNVAHLDAHTAADKVAAIDGPTGYTTQNGSIVRLFSYQFLTATRTAPLPSMTVSGRSYATVGKFVFFSNDGQTVYAVIQAASGSGLLYDTAVTSFAP